MFTSDWLTNKSVSVSIISMNFRCPGYLELPQVVLGLSVSIREDHLRVLLIGILSAGQLEVTG